ncbi:hypothetical protein HFN_0118 [Helicobacter fennelliae MRY12-0050]|uniref:Uncharacterized protein n=1 Tax=Helicobacter fennelliae MRY12-0050 TaxID=1325130 RepID=T1DW01_9HELI|nr:hypothetical protein HFN_0118 [Helicobacter fennelliae MRY12-0050]
MLRQIEKQNLVLELIRDVECAGDHILYIVILVCVECALGRWAMKD